MAAFTHRTTDFFGIDPALLRDAPLISGLLIAAAGAAGLSSTASPAVRHLASDGVTAMLILETEGCHIAAHTFPDRGLLLLDVLVPEARDTEKAVDVFVRRLGASRIASRAVTRGKGETA